ncbi:MAG: transcriptional activator RfaH [Robiginitomaculum sp.]|nr:MAG: transcriptional activator RfaH [Robiginitomaculum sp.]
MSEPPRPLEDNAPAKKWYLVQVKPNGYKRAQENLARQHFDVFCPVIEKGQKRKKKFQSQLSPLFPGYLFVSFDSQEPKWRTINSTYGVSRLVNLNANEPSSVPTPLMSELMARCDSEGRLLPPSKLKVGDTIRVIRGPFADFVSTIEMITPDQRMWVLLDIMGRKTRVGMSGNDLLGT